MKIGIREGKVPNFFSTENCSVLNPGEADAEHKGSIEAPAVPGQLTPLTNRNSNIIINYHIIKLRSGVIFHVRPLIRRLSHSRKVLLTSPSRQPSVI